MKKQLLTMLLLVLAGSATATAQTPEPSGQWKFENPSDLMAATTGNVTLTPAVIGASSIAASTVEEAGITVAEGPAGGSAIFVPAASALKVERAEGAAASTSFSFMIDLKVPDAYVYDGLFQTSPGNSNDGEIFISKSQIGAGALGGYAGCIWNDMWYRVILTNSNGSVKLYVNGVKFIDYETTNTRWEIDPVFYLLCDEDGEKSDTYVSEVAFWETPLTDEEVSALGSIDQTPWITDVSQIKEGDQFYIISDRAKFNGNTTAKPKAMACIQENFPTNWGEQYVYWGNLDKESDGFIWTAEKVGDQWAFLNKENGKYLGNMNTGEADVIFSETPVGYTLTDLTEGAGRFYMTNDESEYSLHVQGYLRGDRQNNSLAKQEVGNDEYEAANAALNGYPGRWRLMKLNADEPLDPRTQIGTAEDFAAFAQAVSEGQTDIDAVLTADIELTGNVMVGTSTNQYAGTFDGQGHKVTYNYSIESNYSGLFAFANNATIRNLFVEGSAVSTAIHFGALIGQANGTVLVENVVTNVDITGNRSGVTGNSGMLGANYANITFNNCAVLGPMGNPGSSMYSPFSGWSNGNSSVTLNNCYAACEFKAGTVIDGNSATLSHGGTSANYFNNCYYLNYIDKNQGTQVTAEQIASGELCYKLNGDQSSIGWYQNLDGTDSYPVPFATHKQVYATGQLRCDGEELPDSPIAYSNTEGQTTIPAHKYGADGSCTVCGSPKQNADGFYFVSNAAQLNWFAQKVAAGRKDIDVLLTADIDLSQSDCPDLMIGTENAEYAGIFDGQGHTITYNYVLVESKWRGLFAFVNNAVIRNLRVEGSAIVTNIHYGALIGRAYGTVLVENVITDVDITGQRSGVTGDGGMLGANYANITFTNCATLGKMGYEGSSMYSSFSAWSNGSSSTTLNNCFTLCELTAGTSTGNCFTLTHRSGKVTINNCYYLNEIGVVQGTAVTAEEVANGTLTARLGNGWYQNIGEDDCPVLDQKHNVVKEIGEAGYATMYVPKAVEAPEGVTANTGSFKEEGGATYLNLNPIEGIIPAWEPVVLKGEPGIYEFLPAVPTEEKSVNIAFANRGLENAADLSSFEQEGLSFSFDAGTNSTPPRYYENGNAGRFYGSNSLTISAAGPITKIIFEFAGNNYALKSGSFEFSDGEYSLSTKTWTGAAETLTLTNTSTSQFRIVSMTVTYAAYPAGIEGNVLLGADEDIEAAGKYILAKPEEGPVGFYLAGSGTIKAGKAYLELPEASGVKAFLFGGDNATSIGEELRTKNEESSAGIFNLSGQRIQKMQRGINIVSGKKILF